MAVKNTIINALAREERRLKISSPDSYLSEAHQKKAAHNLVVMTDLNRLGHNDWVVITAYYSMYHSALALLSRIGLDSKDHASTASVLEYFFREKINAWQISGLNGMKNQKDKVEAITIADKYTKSHFPPVHFTGGLNRMMHKVENENKKSYPDPKGEHTTRLLTDSGRICLIPSGM